MISTPVIGPTGSDPSATDIILPYTYTEAEADKEITDGKYPIVNKWDAQDGISGFTALRLCGLSELTYLELSDPLTLN